MEHNTITISSYGGKALRRRRSVRRKYSIIVCGYSFPSNRLHISWISMAIIVYLGEVIVHSIVAAAVKLK